MLAVVKTPRTDMRIEGDVPPRLLRLLKTEYGRELKLAEKNDESVDFFETDFYRKMKSGMTQAPMYEFMGRTMGVDPGSTG